MTNVLSTFVKCVCVKFLCCCARVLQCQPRWEDSYNRLKPRTELNAIFHKIYMLFINYLKLEIYSVTTGLICTK